MEEGGKEGYMQKRNAERREGIRGRKKGRKEGKKGDK